MIVVGVDAGKSGAFCYHNGKSIECFEMPVIEGEISAYEITELVKIFKTRAEILESEMKFYLEKPSSRPGNAARAMLRYGWGIGILEGVLAAFKIPYRFIHPHVWTKEMHQGIHAKLEAKAKSKISAHQIFPSFNFKRNLRCKKDDEGFIDAALIAEYGVRMERGQKKLS